MSVVNYVARKLVSLSVSFAGFRVQHSHTVNSLQPFFRNAARFRPSLSLFFPRLLLQKDALDAGLTLP